MLATFYNSAITGMSVVVPSKEINIYDEVQYYDNSVKKVDRMRKMVGFHKRRVADENTTGADLALVAAEDLLQSLRFDRNEIDCLIYITQKPDYGTPATCYYLHNQLQLSQNAIAFDVNQACSGFVSGVLLASQMIENGNFNKVLLLNGENSTVGLSLDDRNVAPIFGDAGVATLIEKRESVSWFNIDTISKGYESIIRPFSACRFKSTKKASYLIREATYINQKGKVLPLEGKYLDGLAVFDFTINVVPNNIKALLNYANKSEKDIDYLCLHQANKQIVQEVAKLSGFSEAKAPYAAFETYGNNTMCSIPTTIAMLLEDKKEVKNICCSGFGAGLVCASAILDLSHLQVMPKILNYEENRDKLVNYPKHFTSKEKYIEYWRDKFSKKIDSIMLVDNKEIQ